MTLVLAYTPSGAYTAHPTLTEAVADLRQDLFDRLQNVPAGTSTRWADDDLTRALDRALDEYSFVSPLVQAVMTATLPNTRSYAWPPGAWWIETVEYPTGLYTPRLVPFEDGIVTPSLGTPGAVQSVASAGTLSGSYQWGVSYVKSGGETLVGPLSAPLTLTGGSSGAGALTIPTGPPGTVGRNVYRSKGGLGATWVGQVLDNVSTVYVDSVSDAVAATGAAAPAVDTTANLTQFVMRLRPSETPADTSGVITVTYGCKHQLSLGGTSIPERHHDAVILGAAGYAMQAYQVPTNDLFDYQDGELRNHIDERKVSAAWESAANRVLTEFRGRLKRIQEERNAGVAAIAQWGDAPVRWQRL